MRDSIRRQAAFAMASLGALLSIVFSVVVLGVFLWGEDARMKRQLERASRDLALSSGAEIGAASGLYIGGLADLPPLVQGQVGSAAAGYHEFELEDFEIHARVEREPGQPARFAVIVMREDESVERILGYSLLLGILATGIVGALAGALLARSIARPIEELIAVVDRASESEPSLLDRAALDEISRSRGEVGRLASALSRFQQTSRTALEREQRFLRDASHELRTPLTIIQGAFELLDAQHPTDVATGDRVARIGRSVRRMQASVESLLWMAREETRLSSTPDLSFREQVNDLAEEKRSLLQTGVQVHVDVTAQPPDARQRAMLAMAVDNLLRNSVAHTARGTIEIGVHADEAFVRDTGCGLAADRLARLADPETLASPEGGFGLAIVKRICARYGWRFTLTSEAEQGTTATIFPGEPWPADM